MQLLELFAGTLGFSNGLEEAGFKFDNIYYSEIDKHAIANAKYNRPNAIHIGSVKHFQQWKGKLGRINIISFGSPCQNFSLAGNRKGLKGRSSSLIHYAIMAIEWFRPDIFIWENVKGAFSSNKGEDFQAIIERFANIDGYRLEMQLLNTSWFLPQNRERIYLIGHLTGRSRPCVFPFREDDKLFTKKTGGEKNKSQSKLCTSISTKMGQRADSTFIVPNKAGTLTGGGNSGGLHSDMTVIPVLTPDRKEKRQNGRRFKNDKEPAFTLNCQDQHGILIQKEQTKGNSQGARVYESNGIACNISSGGGGMGGKTGLYDVDNKIRRLTEIECERLQGFPDDWTKYGNYEGKIKEISRTQRYKMLGNAVSVPVVKAIAKRLIENTETTTI